MLDTHDHVKTAKGSVTGSIERTHKCYLPARIERIDVLLAAASSTAVDAP